MAGAAKGALRPGRRVRIDGLQKRPELNGTLGKIVRLEDERWLGVPLLSCSRFPLACARPRSRANTSVCGWSTRIRF